MKPVFKLSRFQYPPLFVVLFLWSFPDFSLAEKPDHDLFGIYTATLDGKNMKLIISHPVKEMTHPRISPNKQWITLTRYNRIGPDGKAEEKNGYAETEIMLVRMDGTELKTLVPAQKGVVNANSSWTPDGKHILYVSTGNPQNLPQIYKRNVKTGKAIPLPTPKGLHVSDPNQVGDWIVFPARRNNFSQQNIWIMKSDASQARQITSAKIPKTKKKFRFLPGDYDPHLSPDGGHVTFMRYFGGKEWHVVVVNVKTGKELDLTAPILSTSPIIAEGVPTWSSDGRLILFRHIELPHIKKLGLYTIRPDGTKRKMIPLPRGYFYGAIAHTFPGEGTSTKTRIIFTARKDPRFQ